MKKDFILFVLCLVLPNIMTAQTIKNGVRYDVSGTTLTISGSGDIDYTCWFGLPIKNGTVESIIIKEGITSIGTEAFRGCKKLTSINIPSSVKSIGLRAFAYSPCLASIDIPNSVTSIGEGAFKGCRSLTSIIIPNSITSLKEEIFQDCSGLISVIIPNSVTSIGEYAFERCSSLKSISMPNSVLSIGISAFRRCGSLTSITISNSCTSIERFTFADCSSLKSIIIPNSVTSIDGHAFEGCSSLKSISIPNSVTSIGDGTFWGCSNLSSIHSLPTFVLQDYKWIHLGIPEEAIYAYLSEHQNEDLIRPFAQGIDDKINRINREKKIKAKGGYTNVSEISNGSKKYWKVSKGGRYGLTDSEGKEIVPCEMEALESAGTGYLKYKINGFWGLMNYTGKILIGTERGYTSIGNFVTFTKRFPYTMNGYKGECDINGRQISKIKVETPKQSVASSSPSSSSSSNSTSSSSSSSSSNSGNKTTTVVVEHHRDPIPVQQWQACLACGGMGTMGCDNCGGSGTKYIGDRLHRCSLCNGQGIIPCRSCYGNKGQYITVYR